MFSYLKALSIHRGGWFLLFLSALILESIALYFQHSMGLKPCVMCIYERVALFGILTAGLLGMLCPRFFIVRAIALLIGLFSAIKGLQLAITHTDYQLNPAPWNQCSPFVEFPSTLPLNQWLPSVFEATGDCSKITWQFLGWSMPQWLIGIFAAYIFILLLVCISQLSRKARQKRIFH